MGITCCIIENRDLIPVLVKTGQTEILWALLVALSFVITF